MKTINTTTNKLNYIQYSRKSSESKERQALSIQDQNAECKNYALREELKVVLKLEESKSAFKPHNRPEFDKMMELIKAGEVNAILTWKPDRLCRNPEEGGLILQLLQDGAIKEIRSATGDVYTQDSDHLILQIHFGMANQYSRNLSQNVRRGLVHKAERGEYARPSIVGFEGFGDRGRRNIRPHAFEAPLIKQAFEIMATGKYSLGYIVQYLYDKGLRTKRGKRIGKSHIHSILTTPTYYGQFYRNGELYQGNYEAIINKQLFDKVQVALGNRSKPKINSHSSPFSGLMVCADCGCTITTTVKEKYYPRTGNKAIYNYHHCTHRKGNCTQAAITAAQLSDELLEHASVIIIDEEVWALGMQLVKEKHKYETEQNMGQLTQLQNKYKSLQDKLNKLVTMRADGELTKDEFLYQKEGLLKEQANIKSLLEDNENSAHGWLELTEKFLNTAFYAYETMKNGEPEEKRQLILDIGQNLFLKDKKLDFRFKEPFDILLKPEYRTNGLPD